MAKDTNGTVATAPTTQKTREEMLKLFASYDQADAKVTAAERAVETAKAHRSSVVASIVAGAGGRKGPFKHPTTGLALSAVERTNKEGGPSNWYFKGQSQSDLIEL